MTFQGFSIPEQNYSKLPHQFIDLLPEIDSLAELKVTLYTLRHTWGFSEYDKPKKITTDEFENGRKRRDGTRIDNGTGLSPNSIRAGLEKAIERGTLTVEVDDTDKARIEKYYSLNMSDDSNLAPRPAKVAPRPAKVEERTEKETIERKNTSFQREGQDKPDKVAEWLKMAQFPGAKMSERVDALLSYLGVTFRRNTETKEWKEFAKYIISAEKEFGWKVEDFVKWLFSKPDYHPDYWSVKRMTEFYPSAFVEQKHADPAPIYNPPSENPEYVQAPPRRR